MLTCKIEYEYKTKLGILRRNRRTDPLMIKKKLTRSDYFIIAANLLPIIGVWFFDWDPREIFLVYCLETIIIGVFNLV